MTRWTRLALVGLVSLALAACQGEAADAPAAGHKTPNEQAAILNPDQIRAGMLVWRIGVNNEDGPSAMVETITRATFQGRPTWRVAHYDKDPASTEVHGFDLYDLDRRTLAPIRSVMRNEAFDLELMFTPQEVTLRRVAQDGGNVEERIALKTAVQGEGPGLRVLIAGLPLRPGFEFRYHQVDRWGGEGESRVKPMTLSVLRQTRVQTAFGAQDALEVVIEPDDGSFRIRSQVRARPPYYPFKVEYLRGETSLVSEVTTMAFEGGNVERGAHRAESTMSCHQSSRLATVQAGGRVPRIAATMSSELSPTRQALMRGPFGSPASGADIGTGGCSQPTPAS